MSIEGKPAPRNNPEELPEEEERPLPEGTREELRGQLRKLVEELSDAEKKLDSKLGKEKE